MKTSSARQILQEISQIEHMESGKLCVIRHGAKGPFYNLQYREKGKPVSQYVPRDQVEAVTQNTANYRKFKELVDEYSHTLIQSTREERTAGFKKKTSKPSVASRVKNSSS